MRNASLHLLLSSNSARRWALGSVVALLAFAGLGTVSALWNNPLFMRMTPAGGWEIGLLAALSALLGLYVAIRRPACTNCVAGTGGVLGFLGVACPVCNKVLVLLVGGELLLAYFELERCRRLGGADPSTSGDHGGRRGARHPQPDFCSDLQRFQGTP